MLNKKDHKATVFSLRREGLVYLFLVMATLAVYWQVQNYDFVNFDDGKYVVANQHVQEGLTLKSIIWAFTTTHAGNWHPLTWLSHMLDCQFYGVNPGRHHLTNLFFHIANTLLLFFVFRKMTDRLWQSAFVAVLFALHPLNVESVAWVSERKNVLSTFFWMLTMWSYIGYVDYPVVKRYILVVLFFILGLMSKPMLVTLPIVLLLMDYWPLKRLQINPWGTDNSRQRSIDLRLIWEKTPLFVFVAMSSAVTFYAEKHGGTVASLDVMPLNVRIANALVSYLKYIEKMIYPSKLAVLYPHMGIIFPWWEITGACLLLVAISFVAIKALKQSPYFTVGWLWYLGTLLPVIGLVQVGIQSMADRYTYVPLIGLFIIIAWGVPELVAQWEHRKKWLAILSTVIVAALMAVTWKQVGYWKNSITLFGHTLKVTTNNYVPHYNLGIALEFQGRTEEAIDQYLQALRIRPDYVAAHNDLGKALDKLGRTEEAIDHYLQALQIKPDFSEAHNNLGNAFLKQGKAAEAVRHFNEALRFNPQFVEAYNSLSIALISMGKIDEAIAGLQKALQINPEFVETHVNLGGALINLGNVDEAMVHFRKALQIKPDIPEVHINLGVALANMGKVEEALTHFRKALQIDPDNAQAAGNLNKTLAVLKEIDANIVKIQQDLKLKPKDPVLNFQLGDMYRIKGETDKAINYYQHAILLQPEFTEAMYHLAKLYIDRNEYEKALSLYQKMLTFLPDNSAIYYNIACIYARQNRSGESVSWLQKAVGKGFDDWKHIKTDVDLGNIRNSLEYKELIKGH